MGKIAKERLKREYLETLKSNERYRWFTQIEKLIKKGHTAAGACKEVGIGRSKYNYWNRRIKEKRSCMKPGARITASMFKDLSKAPHYSPRQIPDKYSELIIKIRKKSGNDAETISYILKTKYQVTISVTGVYKVLKRSGLIKERKYHQKKAPKVVKRDYVPGEKVQIDTKYVKVLKGKTYYQFGAIDVATGIIFKALYENIDGRCSTSFLRDVVRFFPFKIKNIQTDNGFEYTWRLTPEIKKVHPFTVQCELMGMSHVLIPPASPTFNSHIERTHRIDNQELWRTKQFRSLSSMKSALKKYVVNFNKQRATRSKKWRTPIEYANQEFGLNIERLVYRVQDV